MSPDMRFVKFLQDRIFKDKSVKGKKQINHDFFVFQQKSINASLSVEYVLNLKDELKV